jgi:diguanylate cyclase (GGDEF)-like protein/PAS domain S-box-containing protein
MAAQLQSRTRELVATQTELAASEAHHRLLADSVTDMITLFGPDFRRRYVSPACRDLLGYAPEEMVGREPGGIVHPDDWLLLDATLNAPLKAGQETARGTYRALRKDGRCIWLESSGRRLPDGSGYVVVTRDVSERKTFEEQLEAANRRLEDLAAQDPLTGLANRRRFEEMLSVEHRRARRLRCPLAIVLIDADRFKAYNDRYGHPAGDACLQAIARAIDGVLRRPQDLAARLGGEEFIVLLPATDTSGAAHTAHRIRDAVRALAIQHADSDAGIVTVSIGVACTDAEDETDEAALIDAADQALYGAKRSGRDAVQVGPR